MEAKGAVLKGSTSFISSHRPRETRPPRLLFILFAILYVHFAGSARAGETGTNPPPVISAPGGTYVTPLRLRMQAFNPAAEIWYTLDGTAPQQGAPSIQYNGQLILNGTGPFEVRAGSFGGGLGPSPLIGAQFSLVTTEASSFSEVSAFQMDADASSTAEGSSPWQAINPLLGGNIGWRAPDDATTGWLRVDFGEGIERRIGRLSVRAADLFPNGAFKKYRIYVTSELDPASWGEPAAQGEWTWDSTSGEKVVDFPPATGRTVVLECVETGGTAPAIGHLAVFEAGENAVPQVHAPVASLPPGRFPPPVLISLATPTEGAEIWYTLDGTEPVQGAPSVKYSSPVVLLDDDFHVVKAKAFANGFNASETAEFGYLLSDPPADGYAAIHPTQMTVDASSSLPGFSPALVLDGVSTSMWHNAESNLNPDSPQWLRFDFGERVERTIGRISYQPFIQDAKGNFLRVRAFVTSSASTIPADWGEPVADEQWTWKSQAETKVLTFVPKSGRFVILQCLESADGSAAASAVMIYGAGENTVPVLPTPSFSVSDGSYLTPARVRISSEVSGTEIWYTTDGTEPTQTAPSIRYGGEFLLSGNGERVVKAKAFSNLREPSGTATGTFTLHDPAAGAYEEIAKSLMDADASSFLFGWEPFHAIDGLVENPGWHSDIAGGSTDPQWIRFDFGPGVERTIGRLKYRPRPDAPNGTFTKYRIYVTSNPTDFGAPVIEGSWTWSSQNDEKTVDLPNPRGRYLILYCVESALGWASAGEVSLFEPGADVLPTLSSPQFSLGPGSYEAPVTLNISSPDATAEIWFTLDGTEPTQSAPSLRYSSPVTLTDAGVVNIRATAFAAGYRSSSTAALDVTITPKAFEIKKNTITADASSFAAGWDPFHVIDGSPGIAWHSALDTEDSTTEWIRLDFGEGVRRNVGRLTYVPRADAPHGTFVHYRVFATDNPSSNPADWGTPVADDQWTWGATRDRKTIDFPGQPSRFIVLQCLQALEGWASAAEISLFEIGAPTPDPAPTPTASLASGEYGSPLMVHLSSAAEGELWYTTDGSEPTKGTPSQLYSGEITLTGSGLHTVRARSYVEGMSPGRIATFTYTLTEPAAGTFIEVPAGSIRADASSSAPGWEPGNALDRNNNTSWHCAVDREESAGEWIRFDFGEGIERTIGRLRYRRRADAPHGSFTRFRIFVTSESSTDLASLGTPAMEGTWDWVGFNMENTIDFLPRTGRYVILECLDSLIGWASAAEISLYQTSSQAVLPAPVSSLDNGVWASPVTVALTSIGGSEIWYTLDGSEPTQSAPSIKYVESLSLSGDGEHTIKAKAFAPGVPASETRTIRLTLEDAPSAQVQEIEKRFITADASSSAPGWEPSHALDGSISSAWHCEVEKRDSHAEWIRFDFGEGIERSVTRLKYHPRTDAPHGTFTHYRVWVTSNSSTEAADWGTPVAEDYWTWTSPGTEDRLLSFPATSGRYVILQCLDSLEGWASLGEIWLYEDPSSGFVLTEPAEVLQPPANYLAPARIVLSSATPGAEIWYTTDGTTPSRGAPSLLFSERILLTETGVQTIKARAFADDHAPSVITTFTYGVTLPALGDYDAVRNDQMSASASSFGPGEEPDLALDENPQTGWHSGANTESSHAEWLRLDFGAGIERSIGGVSYRRTFAKTGTFARYRIFITSDTSDNPENWGAPVAEGTWEWNSPGNNDQRVQFRPRNGRFVIFQCLDSIGGWASASDVWVFQTDPATLPKLTQPFFSLPSGTYVAPIRVHLTTAPDSETWYTLDGSAPIQGSPSLPYTEDVILSGAGWRGFTARSFAPEHAPSGISSSAYNLTEPGENQYLAVNSPLVTADASSFASNALPSNAADGRASTYWRSDPASAGPQWLRIDFGPGIERSIGRLRYQRRLTEGTITQYRIFITSDSSNDPEHWGTPAAEGEWTYGAQENEKVVDFTSRSGRYVILQCLSSVNGGASAAEVLLYQTRPDTLAQVLPVTASVPSGNYVAPLRVRLTMGAPGAEIWYTTDGSNPVQGSPSSQYTGDLTLTETGVHLIKAMAFAPNMRPSPIFSGQYTLQTGTAADPIAIHGSQMTADASSFAPGWEPSRAIDGNVNQAWHSALDTQTSNAEWLRLDFGEGLERSIARVEYFPRQDAPHGTFTHYRIFVTSTASTNPNDWGAPVAEGDWDWPARNTGRQVDFTPVRGRFVILQCTASLEGWASAGEVTVYQAD